MMAIIRFEALRFARQPRLWLFMLLALAMVGLPQFMGRRDHLFLSVSQPVLWSVLGGYMIATWLKHPDGSGFEYLLSRVATRRRILVGRWIFYTLLVVGLWSALAVTALARGSLSSGSSGYVNWEAVPMLEATGHTPQFDAEDRAEYTKWLEQGQPTTRKSVDVRMPWAGGTVLTLTLLGFLLSLISQSVDGPTLSRNRRRLREPAMYLLFIPLVAAIAFMMAPIFGFLGREEKVFVWLYTHLAVAVAASIVVTVFYAWISLLAWNRADA